MSTAVAESLLASSGHMVFTLLMEDWPLGGATSCGHPPVRVQFGEAGPVTQLGFTQLQLHCPCIREAVDVWLRESQGQQEEQGHAWNKHESSALSCRISWCHKHCKSLFRGPALPRGLLTCWTPDTGHWKHVFHWKVCILMTQ